MTYKKIYNIENNQLIIQLPESFKGKSKLLVTIDDKVDVYKSKLSLLKKAKKDPLFQADLQDINNDFFHTDFEAI